MVLGSRRTWRTLVALCVTLVTAASAGAAFGHERPRTLGPALAELTDAGPDAGAGSPQIAEHRLLVDDDSAVAPRVAEARPVFESSGPALARVAARRELAPDRWEDRLASRSGCAATTRWCLAHATSTQAP